MEVGPPFKLRTAMHAAAALIALVYPSSASTQSYIGAERCKSCHEFAYRIWSDGPHATAQRSLSAAQLEDPKCNTCHTMLPDQLEERYLGIQCERCHGAGRYYHPDFVMKDQELARAVGLIDVTDAHCRQCHDEGTPAIEAFSYSSMWAEIDHGRTARVKWAASQPTAEAPK